MNKKILITALIPVLIICSLLYLVIQLTSKLEAKERENISSKISSSVVSSSSESSSSMPPKIELEAGPEAMSLVEQSINCKIPIGIDTKKQPLFITFSNQTNKDIVITEIQFSGNSGAIPLVWKLPVNQTSKEYKKIDLKILQTTEILTSDFVDSLETLSSRINFQPEKFSLYKVQAKALIELDGKEYTFLINRTQDRKSCKLS